MEMNMRTHRWILLLLMLAVSCAATAQGKGKGKDKGADEFLRAQAYVNAPPAAQATASRLLINPFGEVDGVLLDTGTIVTFPPHMGGQLAAAIKAGDPVAVKGYPETPTQIKGYVITNTRSNQTVMTQPKPPAGAKMPPHLRGVGLKEMSAQGEVRHLRYGGHGEVNGLILADGTIVRFPREASYQLATLLRVGQGIAAAGYGTQNEFGRALEVTALGPQGQTPQPLYRR
jgi:hypothetical protein